MTAAIERIQATSSSTDELFDVYLRTRHHHKPLALFSNQQHKHEAIVNAFRWRAAALVSCDSVCLLVENTQLIMMTDIRSLSSEKCSEKDME